MSELDGREESGKYSNQKTLLFSALGALFGASVGAMAWFCLEYYANYQIGYIAIASGVFAGMGAVHFGGRNGLDIGIIAAVAGLAGVLAGSYAGFRVAMQGDEVRAEVAAMVTQMEGFDEATPRERDYITEVVYQEVLDSVTYLDYAKDDLGFLLLFGGIGVFYGFRTGRGNTDEEFVASNDTDDDGEFDFFGDDDDESTDDDDDESTDDDDDESTDDDDDDESTDDDDDDDDESTDDDDDDESTDDDDDDESTDDDDDDESTDDDDTVLSDRKPSEKGAAADWEHA